NQIYETYDRIFGCRGHGWANLQSNHINLPFCGDREFGQLHAGIRLILPLIPAISASTPLFDGRPTGFLNTRLLYYRDNQKKIPSITGKVIPERVFAIKDYEKNILEKIYKDISSFDPEGVIQYEWLNSRGAIPRFDRNAFEIRTIDIQECPLADISLSALITETIKAHVKEMWVPFSEQSMFHEDNLSDILWETAEKGFDAVIDDRDFLRAFGWKKTPRCKAGDLWKHLKNELVDGSSPWSHALDTICEQGPLAERILKSLKNDYSKENIIRVYRELGDCLEKNILFIP
ncbi:MAG: glutamate--cysteine ligase, partial [Candidatus Aureabacteria bacterium]|nr:glutamate--cysteine ligase [Candidatus Auribacterota bacterium]